MHRFVQHSLAAAVLASLSAAVAPVAGAISPTVYTSSVAGSTGAVSNPNGALGSFAASEGGYAIDPFFPPYTQNASAGGGAILATIGSSSATYSSSLTLEFSKSLPVSAGTYLGVYSSVGLINVQTTPGEQPQAATGTTPAQLELSTPSEAIVSVSADGKNFVTLNGGNPIAFDNPTNAYTTVDDTVVTSGGYTFVSPQPAAPGQTPQLASPTPFLGNLSEFSGMTESQIFQALGGTAGGTWINVYTAGLPSIEYVRFTVPAGDTAYINAAALSDPAVATPEPTAWALLLIPILVLPVRKGWKKIA